MYFTLITVTTGLQERRTKRDTVYFCLKMDRRKVNPYISPLIQLLAMPKVKFRHFFFIKRQTHQAFLLYRECKRMTCEVVCLCKHKHKHTTSHVNHTKSCSVQQLNPLHVARQQVTQPPRQPYSHVFVHFSRLSKSEVCKNHITKDVFRQTQPVQLDLNAH